jgi:hypothetical protein
VWGRCTTGALLEDDGAGVAGGVYVRRGGDELVGFVGFEGCDGCEGCFGTGAQEPAGFGGGGGSGVGVVVGGGGGSSADGAA